MQNFEKHELFCENMNFLTKFVNNWPKPSGNTDNSFTTFTCTVQCTRGCTRCHGYLGDSIKLERILLLQEQQVHQEMVAVERGHLVMETGKEGMTKTRYELRL